MVPKTRNLGSTREAAKIAEVTQATIRTWIKTGLLHAERVANGKYHVDLDQVRSMRIVYPRDSVDDRIRELVEGAPQFTAAQINRIRLLLHAAPEVSSTR